MALVIERQVCDLASFLTNAGGHAKKRTGLLNNEMYRGRLVWGGSGL